MAFEIPKLDYSGNIKEVTLGGARVIPYAEDVECIEGLCFVHPLLHPRQVPDIIFVPGIEVEDMASPPLQKKLVQLLEDMGASCNGPDLELREHDELFLGGRGGQEEREEQELEHGRLQRSRMVSC